MIKNLLDAKQQNIIIMQTLSLNPVLMNLHLQSASVPSSTVLGDSFCFSLLSESSELVAASQNNDQ